VWLIDGDETQAVDEEADAEREYRPTVDSDDDEETMANEEQLAEALGDTSDPQVREKDRVCVHLVGSACELSLGGNYTLVALRSQGEHEVQSKLRRCWINPAAPLLCSSSLGSG
jgi:hypothetical protein